MEKASVRQMRPPVGGLLGFESCLMPPLAKICPKTVCPKKGGSLSVEGVFAKKNSGAGEDCAVGAFQSVLVTKA
jgi:hypothetical protein